ncbi:unnamed protein product [Phytomonas sp. EM1]|eukprot:CCW60411.1 unnamed protein product [Phytomonas sp. isolate EM1]
MPESVLVDQEAPALEETKPAVLNETETTENKADAPRPKNSSYYYWHGHEKERAKVGDVAPMPSPVLVSRDDVVAKPTHERLPATVKKYQWCDDGPKTVSVYVRVAEEAGEVLDESSVEVEILAKSVRVTFSTTTVASAARNCKQLRLSLAKKVNPEASSYRIKSSKEEICLKLAKAHGGTWFDLVGTPAADSDEEDDVGGSIENEKAKEGEGEIDSNDE